MARLSSVRQIWTFIFGYGAALLAMIVGPATASRMLETHHHPGTAYLVAMTLLGALSLVPLIALLWWMYHRSDEYERHGMLLSATIGFAISVVAMAALDMLSRSDVAPAWTWLPRWWLMVLCWALGMLVVHLAKRRAA